MSIKIDSVTYDLPLKVVSRQAEILFKYAERTADGVLHAEAIGTYYNYEIEVGMSINNVTAYKNLWQKLTEPTASHTIELPDEDTTPLTFSCYFANIRDEVTKYKTTQPYFKNLSFKVIATSPARVPA